MADCLRSRIGYTAYKKIKLELYKKQHKKCKAKNCLLKGLSLPIEYYHMDHEIPISHECWKGDKKKADNKGNLQLLCQYCNQLKGKENNEYLELRLQGKFPGFDEIEKDVKELTCKYQDEKNGNWLFPDKAIKALGWDSKHLAKYRSLKGGIQVCSTVCSGPWWSLGPPSKASTMHAALCPSDYDQADKKIERLIQQYCNEDKPEGGLFPLKALKEVWSWGDKALKKYLKAKGIHHYIYPSYGDWYFYVKANPPHHIQADRYVEALITKHQNRRKPKDGLFPRNAFEEALAALGWSKKAVLNYYKSKGFVTHKVCGWGNWSFDANTPAPSNYEELEIQFEKTLQKWRNKAKPNGALCPHYEIKKSLKVERTAIRRFRKSKGLVSRSVKGWGQKYREWWFHPDLEQPAKPEQLTLPIEDHGRNAWTHSYGSPIKKSARRARRESSSEQAFLF